MPRWSWSAARAWRPTTSPCKRPPLRRARWRCRPATCWATRRRRSRRRRWPRRLRGLLAWLPGLDADQLADALLNPLPFDGPAAVGGVPDRGGALVPGAVRLALDPLAGGVVHRLGHPGRAGGAGPRARLAAAGPAGARVAGVERGAAGGGGGVQRRQSRWPSGRCSACATRRRAATCSCCSSQSSGCS